MTRSPWARGYARTPEAYIWGTAPSAFARKVSALLPRGARVLELGCGEGRECVFFASRGLDVTGIEISSAGLRKAARLARERGVEVRWVQGDMAQPTVHGRFDLVYSCGSIHYVRRRERARFFAHLRGLTRPRGYHAHVVFTNRLIYVEQAEVVEYFVPGEIARAYDGWLIREDVHRSIKCAEDGMPHRHSVEQLVVQRIA